MIMNFSSFLTRNRIIAFSVLLVFILLFSVRGIILKKAIHSIDDKLADHQYVADWEGARFKGLRTLFVKQIQIRHKVSGNEVKVDSMTVRVRILPLLVKHIRIKKFDCAAIQVKYFSGDTLAKEDKKIEKDTAKPFASLMHKSLVDFANKNIRRIFSYTPKSFHIGRMAIYLNHEGKTTMVMCNNFRIIRGNMNAMLAFTGDNKTIQIPLEGKLDRSAPLIEIHMANPDTALLPLPYLKDCYGFATGFDSLDFVLDMSDRSRHTTRINGKFSFAGFELKGERLSTGNIKINHFKSSFRVNIGENFVEVDSSTACYLNEIKLNPYARLLIDHDPVVDIKLCHVTWDAGAFFRSLPQGMFTSLNGLEAKGQLHYFLDFSLNLNKPDSLIFRTKLTSTDFSILKFGTDDYRMLNGSFMHHVYEKGKMVASFMVGPENPDFVPLDQISPFLRASVMTSEDGAFFYHNGFNTDAFREAVITNYKKQSFARGGSTITMQLVKNVFLTRNKNVARKIEEALIVWLIENKRLVSKERMYEVYLNIIEWGPGKYGINQASHFYYKKRPSELNLQESIYLASIIPHPKWYKYTFIANGVPRPFYANYSERLKQLMVRKGFIQSSDTIGVVPFIKLTGPAADVFAASDTTAVDSMNFNELEMLPALIKLSE
jgi:hypothetical protein